MTQTLTRSDLAEAINHELGISHMESSELVDATINEIAQELAKHNAVKLSSFGTFDVRKKNARMGRNPKTKKDVPISARTVVTFHSSNILTQRANKDNI